MNTPLPYKHIQDLSERQLLQVIVDKLCCVAGKYILDIYGGAAAAYSLRSLSKDTIDVVRVRRSSDNAEADFTAREITNGTLENWVNAELPLPLDTATAAAAYSLRNLKTSYTGSVIRVRRSVDNAEDDFTATEITDGTLLAWVNTGVVKYTSDFTSGNEDLGETNGVGTDGETIAGVIDAYKFTLNNGNVAHQIQKSSLYEIGKTYTINFDYYIPSTNQKVNQLAGTAGLGFPIQSTLDAWTSVSYTGVANSTIQQFRIRDDGSNFIDADGDVIYLKNIVVTQTTADGFVTTWYDQAGSNDATQATAANQPKIVDAGVLVEENGKPAVEFDGVDDFIKASSSISNYPITNTIVQKNDPANAGHSWSLNNDTSATQYYSNSDFSSSSIIFHNVRNSANVFFTQTWLSAIQNTMFCYSKASNDHAFAINGGVLNTSTTNTTFPNANNIVIGRLRFIQSGLLYNGLVQELIVWNSDQSSNRTGIETNINDYYSIYAQDRDGFVTTWYDQSGNGNDAAQTVAASQPKIVSSGSIILEGGKAAIQWDGIDDELNFSGDISATEVSSIIVAKAITHNTNNRFFGWRNSSFSFLSALIQGSNSTTLRGMSQTNDTTQLLLYSGVDYTNNSLISMYNASVWRINGNEFTGAVSTGSTGVRSTNGLALGSRGDGGNDGNVQFQEAIFYPSDQSSNRVGIEQNINNHYNIYP